jgi:hypothetical protein
VFGHHASSFSLRKKKDGSGQGQTRKRRRRSRQYKIIRTLLANVKSSSENECKSIKILIT